MVEPDIENPITPLGPVLTEKPASSALPPDAPESEIPDILSWNPATGAVLIMLISRPISVTPTLRSTLFTQDVPSPPHTSH